MTKQYPDIVEEDAIVCSYFSTNHLLAKSLIYSLSWRYLTVEKILMLIFNAITKTCFLLKRDYRQTKNREHFPPAYPISFDTAQSCRFRFLFFFFLVMPKVILKSYSHKFYLPKATVYYQNVLHGGENRQFLIVLPKNNVLL